MKKIGVQKVAATAEIGEAIRRRMVARRILDGVVKNKYANNIGKLAAWRIARHAKRARRPAPPTP